MSRMMLGSQIFMMMIFFIGAQVEANPVKRCESHLKFAHNKLHYTLASESELGVLCLNMSSFHRCVDEVAVEETGYNLDQMADLLQGTEIGKVMRILANIKNLLEELCTEGNPFREAYLEISECFRGIDINVVEQCEELADSAYENFNELQTRKNRDPVYEKCLETAYQLGCLGSKVKEECGEQGFDVYKQIVRKIGFFKSGICSRKIMRTIKGSFINSLEVSNSQKSVYRVVARLRKRRR